MDRRQTRSMAPVMVSSSEQSSMNTAVVKLTGEEIKALIPAFNPEGKNNVTASEWIRKMDNLVELYHFDGRRAVLAAAIRLEGSAKIWFEASQNETISWEEFKAELLKNFPTEIDVGEIHRMLSNRKWKKDESMEAYFHDVVKQAKRIGLGFDVTKNYLIEGIQDKTLRGALINFQGSSLTEFLAHMKRAHKALVGNEQSTQKEECDSKRRSMEYPQGKGKKYKFDESAKMKKRCYECGSDQHLIKDCPKKKRT
ncbi:uncharacterized protein LOC129794270 [Lutzomyia longipalpis]|uniref:uncharacterized protein LOC129794270 n=1 Tax=Lutzomyia longipalpis TaxID=7200 RepID=UPI00248440C0|nr:uncharacterized protein LOC129794270 [Lutzomyia longipalpis]XP_055691022.1 uncharacterized protein LOC129794270 [Lutzomyia longipalpis]XP_055691023.1 uncharacterized protein LOC129794270 [Lutzomyia longipalpis]XP_055691024.1 uncharacterized protein LOC129794270 [Lutzomyia longipalpis]